MQQRDVVPTPQPHKFAERRLVVVIVDEFLDWCEKHRAPDTYRWYKDRLNSFCKSIDADLTTDHLKPHHVQKWMDNYVVELASGSRRNLIASIKRAMKWAEEQGYIERSPLAHMRKPGCGRKEQIVTAEQYQALLDRTADEEFKDLITVTWEIGCRPQESLRVEARADQAPHAVGQEGCQPFCENLTQWRGRQRGRKRRNADDLPHCVAQRSEMMAYDQFERHGWDVGTGPIEAMCKASTRRIKGSGMRWDIDHAEAMMALECMCQSNLWDQYWTKAVHARN